MKLFLKLYIAATLLVALALAWIPAQAAADNFAQAVYSPSIASQVNSISSSGYSSSAAHLQFSSHSNRIFNQAQSGRSYSGAAAKNLIATTKKFVSSAGAQVASTSKQLRLQQQSIIDRRRFAFAVAIEQDRLEATAASELQRIKDSQAQAQLTATLIAVEQARFGTLIRQARAKTAVRVRQIKNQSPIQSRKAYKRQRLNILITQKLKSSRQTILKLEIELEALVQLRERESAGIQSGINQAGAERSQIIEAIAAAKRVQAADIVAKEVTAAEEEFAKISVGIAVQFDGLHASCQSSLRKLTGNKNFRLPRPLFS